MGSEFNMNPRYTLSASLLLAVAQASSLYPASTFPLESFDRLMALSRNERTLYSGFEPPMSYEADIDVVASARSLNCKSEWTVSASKKFCYQYFPITNTVKGWTWDQARRECKKAAYTAGQSRADLAFPENEGDNDVVENLIKSKAKDVWLGAKFTEGELQNKTSDNPETWEDYTGWTSWMGDGNKPAQGISLEQRLLMKGDSNNRGKWAVWNGNFKKGFVCQYKKNSCKDGWVEETTLNKCFKAFIGEDNKMTWQNAERKCEEQGLNGHLASMKPNARITDLAKEASGSLGTSYDAYWLGGSVQYNDDGSLTYTWTDGTLKWPGKDDNKVPEAAWANGQGKPTAWPGEVNTFIDNQAKIGLSPGTDKTNFICQYDVPGTVKQLLQSWMFGNRRRSLF